MAASSTQILNNNNTGSPTDIVILIKQTLRIYKLQDELLDQKELKQSK